MTTYKLKLTPADGPVTEKTGLSYEQALGALTDLMHGTLDDESGIAERDERYLTPLAA
jgi:hypothetical protein